MAKIVEACIFNLKQEGVPSRDNTTTGLREKYSAGEIMQAIKDFTKSISRCMLVLYSDDGREISILPTLRDEAVAFEEKPIPANRTEREADPNDKIDFLWDISMETWPK